MVSLWLGEQQKKGEGKMALTQVFADGASSVLLVMTLEYLEPREIYRSRRVCKNTKETVEGLCLSSYVFCRNNLLNSCGLPLPLHRLHGINWFRLGKNYMAALMSITNYEPMYFQQLVNLPSAFRWTDWIKDHPEHSMQLSAAVYISLTHYPSLPDLFTFYWSVAVWIAAVDDLQLIELFLQKSLDWMKDSPERQKRFRYYINQTFGNAAQSGSVVIIDYLLKLAPTLPSSLDVQINAFEGFSLACKEGQLEAVRYFLSRPDTTPPFGKEVSETYMEDALFLVEAAGSGNIQVFELLQSQLPNLKPEASYYEAIVVAASGGHTEMFANLCSLKEYYQVGWGQPPDGVRPDVVLPPRAKDVWDAAAKNGGQDIMKTVLKALLDQSAVAWIQGATGDSVWKMEREGNTFGVELLMDANAVSTITARDVVRDLDSSGKVSQLRDKLAAVAGLPLITDGHEE